MHQVWDLVAPKVQLILEYEIMHSILNIPIKAVGARLEHVPKEQALHIHLTIPYLVTSKVLFSVVFLKYFI